MIKIRTLYIVLPLTILMAVGCYLKGWTAGIALWALLALVCVGRILRERKEKNGAEDAVRSTVRSHSSPVAMSWQPTPTYRCSASCHSYWS